MPHIGALYFTFKQLHKSHVISLNHNIAQYLVVDPTHILLLYLKSTSYSSVFKAIQQFHSFLRACNFFSVHIFDETCQAQLKKTAITVTDLVRFLFISSSASLMVKGIIVAGSNDNISLPLKLPLIFCILQLEHPNLITLNEILHTWQAAIRFTGEKINGNLWCLITGK